MNHLHVDKGKIKESSGRAVDLRGVNFGCWLLMEGYILGGRNIPEWEFKNNFKEIYGKGGLEEFENKFRKNFITEDDFRRVKSWGFNFVRIPFHYRFFEDDRKPFKYREEGLKIFKTILRWASRYNLYVLFDMHAACGAQNGDWHSDSKGKALLWANRRYQERFFRLWEFLTCFLRDKPFVGGFDLVNEPVLERGKNSAMVRVYKEAIRRIRKIDRSRILFLEPNTWAQDIEGIRSLAGENIVFSVHTYLPLEFTFNFIPGLKYPGKIKGKFWNKEAIKKYVFRYRRVADICGVPLHVGEFGVNSRCSSCYGEQKYLRDLLDVFRSMGVHWNYWTYKAIPSGVFPDGILQYPENPSWVRREGPLSGWENIYSDWKKFKSKIVYSWFSRNWRQNSSVLSLLKRYG